MVSLKPVVDLIVVIPVGPGCKLDFIIDTIDSFVYYNTLAYKIIIADDSQKETGYLIRQYYPDVQVIKTNAPMGKLSGLYITLSLAFRYALDHYRFHALLRMDTDALIIGEEPAREAVALFKSNPAAGIAGQYPFDYEGKPWDISWPNYKIYRCTRTLDFFTQPLAHWKLRKLVKRAVKKGYRIGESVFGGVCFYSERVLLKLQSSGLLPDYSLKSVELEEDHLFAILVRSIGFTLQDLSSKDLPFGCAWKGLPAPPEELFKAGKKIIHSTRYSQAWKEDEIRGWFRDRRKVSAIQERYVG